MINIKLPSTPEQLNLTQRLETMESWSFVCPEPAQARKEHENSKHKDLSQQVDTNVRLSCCETSSNYKSLQCLYIPRIDQISISYILVKRMVCGSKGTVHIQLQRQFNKGRDDQKKKKRPLLVLMHAESSQVRKPQKTDSVHLDVTSPTESTFCNSHRQRNMSCFSTRWQQISAILIYLFVKFKLLKIYELNRPICVQYLTV